MNWVPCKVRLPTEADADKNGCVLVEYDDGERSLCLWERVHRLDAAWLAIPEYVPLPDPPEGYEVLADYDAEPIADAVYLRESGQWEVRNLMMCESPYPQQHIYAVPITPPEPQYRPFANADEFRPFRERWWRHKETVTEHPPLSVNDGGYGGWTWAHAFRSIEFDDGTR
jgi:hypothetical protein